MTPRKKRLIRHIVIALLLTATVLYSPIAVINSKGFQQWFLDTYKPLAPWKVNFLSLRIQPFPFKVRIRRLEMIHPDGHQITVKNFRVWVKLSRLLAGRLVIKPLKITSPTFTFSEKFSRIQKTDRKRLKLRTLLLLQNIRLEEGQIRNIRINLPGEKNIHMKRVQVGFKPSPLGETSLEVGLQNISFGGNRIAKLDLDVKTDFDRWKKAFPYIADTKGSLKMEQSKLGPFQIRDLDARLHLQNYKIILEKFVLRIGENPLLGKFETNIRSQKFKLELETPKPIAIPELESATRTFNIAGDLKLALKAEGKGYDFKTSSGKGEFSATHLFKNSEEHPFDVQTRFDWEKGLMQIRELTAVCDNATLKADGTFRMKSPSFNISFSANDFPIERFFEKFADKDLNPIHGKGTLEGTFKGFGKEIELRIKGEANEGGYGPLLAQKAKVDLEITYPRLKLDGTILANDQPTGEAHLLISYGPKKKGEPRPKKIAFNAKFTAHPLETLLPGHPISGEADGRIELAGAPGNIRGSGELLVKEGEFYFIVFEQAKIPFSLTPKKLLIEEAQWVLPDATATFANPVSFEFTPGGLHITGKPFNGLIIDIQYAGAAGEWQVKKIGYQDAANPEFQALISGRITQDNVGLKGKGKIDLKTLEFLSRALRNGNGPVAFDLTTHGTFNDLKLNGFVRFEDTLLSLRIYPLTTENLKGTLHFSGNKISTESLTGLWGVGSFEIKGSLTHERWQAKSFDLALKGSQIYFRTQDKSFRMEYDADLTLKGTVPHALLKGNVTILDGRYTKDFNIIEEITEKRRPPRELSQPSQKEIPILLDIQVRNFGTLVIDNNVGRIELLTNLRVRGTNQNPTMDGSIEVAEGNIHYLGVDFEITRGFIEFREPGGEPYLEVEAEQEVADAHIRARLYGSVQNLKMDLEGNSPTLGPLEKKDVVSLLLFGVTASERAAQTRLGPEMAGEQIAHALQRPLAKYTHLDVVKLKSSSTQGGERTRSFHVGKRITDRLHLEFASEVEREDALQTFLLEYWLTDFFILKGARRNEEGYQLNIGFRLRGE